MADLCRLVNQWFIAALGFCGTIQTHILHWLVDSEKGGSKNGSSRPIRRGTMPGKIIDWLGVVVDFASNG